MTKFFNKLKKPCFWPILGPFSQFLGQKFFSRKSGSVTHNFIWVSSTMPKFRKNWWYNSKKTPRQTEGRNDGQTLFHRALPVTARVPNNMHRSKLHLYHTYWRKHFLQLLKVTLFHGHFSRFLDCKNGTKSCKASHM